MAKANLCNLVPFTSSKPWDLISVVDSSKMFYYQIGPYLETFLHCSFPGGQKSTDYWRINSSITSSTNVSSSLSSSSSSLLPLICLLLFAFFPTLEIKSGVQSSYLQKFYIYCYSMTFFKFLPNFLHVSLLTYVLLGQNTICSLKSTFLDLWWDCILTNLSLISTSVLPNIIH